MKTGVRINKYLADKKIAPRREADRLIQAGKVKVNGEKAVIGQIVSDSDEVTVDTSKQKYIYLAYYKGRGIIAHSPDKGEVDIATRLKTDYNLQGIFPVGRLDKESEGLLILTNDGRVTGPLLDTKNNNEKEYEVTVDKKVSPILLRALQNGVEIEGYRTKKAKVKEVKSDNKKFELTLTEGKKHQIRRMCAALGYQVQNLKRTRVVNIKLGNLKPNQYRKLTAAETKELLLSLAILKS